MLQNNYLSNSFINSDPLTETELNNYFERYKNGDNNAKEIIIEHNIKLVIYLVHKNFKTVYYDEEDLVEIGLVGLVKAVNTFSLKKNIKFSTYASRCILNEIVTFLKKEKKHLKELSLNKIISNDKDGKELTLKEILPNDRTDFTADLKKAELYEKILAAIEELPDLEKETILLYYGLKDGQKRSQKEIAKKLNTYQIEISRSIKKSLIKIRIKLEKDGIIEKISPDLKKKKYQKKKKY